MCVFMLRLEEVVDVSVAQNKWACSEQGVAFCSVKGRAGEPQQANIHHCHPASVEMPTLQAKLQGAEYDYASEVLQKQP